MMSPLSVAQYLKSDSIEFDAVVFDEASQIVPQDAISSLIRADQAIIAGDTNNSHRPRSSSLMSKRLEMSEKTSIVYSKKRRLYYRKRIFAGTTGAALRTHPILESPHYYNNSLGRSRKTTQTWETGVYFEYVKDGVYDRGGSRQNESRHSE